MVNWYDTAVMQSFPDEGSAWGHRDVAVMW